jgi:hypothetical protein
MTYTKMNGNLSEQRLESSMHCVRCVLLCSLNFFKLTCSRSGGGEKRERFLKRKLEEADIDLGDNNSTRPAVLAENIPRA